MKRFFIVLVFLIAGNFLFAQRTITIDNLNYSCTDTLRLTYSTPIAMSDVGFMFVNNGAQGFFLLFLKTPVRISSGNEISFFMDNYQVITCSKDLKNYRKGNYYVVQVSLTPEQVKLFKKRNFTYMTCMLYSNFKSSKFSMTNLGTPAVDFVKVWERLYTY